MPIPIIDGIDTWWIIPGRVLGGEYPGTPQRSGEKIDALIDYGVSTVYNLTHPDDKLESYVFAGRLGFTLMHYPIPNEGVIALKAYDTIVRDIIREMDAGRMVYLHCWGGIGRTATVAGCLMAATTTMNPDEIFTTIDKARAAWSGKSEFLAPETEEQRQIVRDYFLKYGTWGTDV